MMLEKLKRAARVAALALAVFSCGGAEAAVYAKGDFSITTDKAETALGYEAGGSTYRLQYWGAECDKTYTTNGVLTIKDSGTYSIAMKSGKSKTTDRIKIAPGKTVNLTINGLNIAPNPTDGFSDHYGQGRPFDMKGATVTLTVNGTNTFKAPAYSTGIFCPAGSNLTINGSGTLNVTIEERDFAVAGIGGEGKNSPEYIKDTYSSRVVASQDQLARVRKWADDQDSRCGDIVFDGNMTVNVKVRVGDPMKSPTGEGEQVPFWSDGSSEVCLFNPPVIKWIRINSLTGEEEEDDSARLGFGYFAPECGVVAIGGAYDGNITISNGTVNARAGCLGTGIGSVNRTFGKVTINNGTVYAESGYATDHSPSTDYVGFVDYGPAIGWVRYGDSQPGNMVIEINGGTVTAKSGYGAAGIGGGIDSTGGTIKITGGKVTAAGGANGAGIGGGIGQSVTGSTTDQAKIIITGGEVIAAGGINAAGIGGGGNNLGVNVSAGQSGSIVIAGSAKITATGGDNAPGIGAGGSGTDNAYQNACKVQSIAITTTGTVKATGGSGALTNIGTGLLRGSTNIANRYANSTIINLSGAAISGTSDKMPNLITVDSNGNIVVKGNVDLTGSTGSISAEQGKIIAQDIVKYLNEHPGKQIVAASGTTPTLKLPTDIKSQISNDKISGVTVNGQVSASYNVIVTAGAGGSIRYLAGITNTGQSVLSGTIVTLKAVPNSGFHFAKWTESGGADGLSATHSVRVAKETTLHAVFEADRTYTVTASQTSNGTVTPTSASVISGQTQAFTAVPDDNYELDHWEIDNVLQTGKSLTLYVTPTKDNTVIKAFFAQSAAPQPIKASAGKNSVTLSPDRQLNAGESFTITAAGHRQSVKGAANGDTRYIPKSWSISNMNQSGNFGSSAPYTAAVQAPSPTSATNYTVTVTFKLQTWNGSSWVDSSSNNDTKTATLSVKAASQVITKSSNANLSLLRLNGVTPIAPDFSANKTNYSATVISNITPIIIIFSKADSKASVAVSRNGQTIAANSTPVANQYTASVTVSQGNNPVDIVVTAEDGTKKTYTLDIKYRATNVSTYLLDLSIGDSYPLRGEFNKYTPTYTASVPNSVDNVALSFTQDDNAATVTVKVNGSQVDSRNNIRLKVGTNTIAVEVSAADAETRTYTITVTRADAAEQCTVSAGVSPNGGGSVTPQSRTVDKDSLVPFTASAASGYRFSHWLDDGVRVDGNASRSFTANKNKTVTAVFVRQYRISTEVSPSGAGTVTQSARADAGTSVSISASAASGYRFARWEINGTAQSGSTPSINVRADGDKTVRAVFVRRYTISTEVYPSSAAGSVSGANTYDEGAQVALTASPKAGYKFIRWEQGGVDKGSSNPWRFGASANVTVRAVFDKIRHTIAIMRNVDGGTVSGAGEYDAGGSAALTAQPYDDHEFVNWTEGNAVLSTAASFTLHNITSDRSITAVFRKKSGGGQQEQASAHVLQSLELIGGGSDITLNEPFSSSTTRYSAVVANSVSNVTLNFDRDARSAVSVNGAAVTGGTASVQLSNTGANVIKIRVTSSNGTDYTEYTLTITRAVPQYTVTVEASEGGSVTGAGRYDEGANAVLTPNPSAGYMFIRWEVGGVAQGSSNPWKFEVMRDITVKAVFVRSSYRITVSVSPTGSGGVAGLRSEYARGESAVITAAAAAGYEFVKWTEGGIDLSTEPQLRISNVTSDRAITAVFGSVAQGGQQQPSSAALHSLELKSGSDEIELYPSFASNVRNYRASVSASAENAMIMFSCDNASSVTVDGASASGGTASIRLPVTGDNVIRIKVTSSNGIDSTEYTLTIKREQTQTEPSALLTSLSIGRELKPPFSSNTFGYSASVGSDTAGVNVSFAKEDDAASVSVNGIAVSGNSSYIPLEYGDNVISVEVTAAGGISRVYAISVTRLPAQPGGTDSPSALPTQPPSSGGDVPSAPPSSGGGIPSVLPDVPPSQHTYRPAEMQPSSLLSSMLASLVRARMLGFIDMNGVNAMLSGGDGTLVSAVGGGVGSSFVATMTPICTAGMNIIPELYMLSTPNGGSVSFNRALDGLSVKVDVVYSGSVLMSYSSVINGGHMAVTVPTNDIIRRISALSSSGVVRAASTGRLYDITLRIADESGFVNAAMPMRISVTETNTPNLPNPGTPNTPSAPGNGGGGSGCDAGGAGFLVLLALAGLRKKRR